MAKLSVKQDQILTDLGLDLEGKYLTFILEEEEYGVEILKVQEIIQMQKVTPVPGSPDFFRGVINLRGKVIPIVELRKKFLMEPALDTEKTAIIVMLITNGDSSMTMGIIIDDVKEVLDVTASSIEKTPSLGGSIDTGFIMGICKYENGVKMLLDIDKAISTDEIMTISKITNH